MTVRMIVAINHENVIGKDNKIPWFYKNDLQFFKQTTEGNVVIMGRKTWESLPPRMRPLPNRINIVVTKSTGIIGAECAVPSVAEGVRYARSYYPARDIWLIGGRGVYEEGITDLATEAKISIVPDAVEPSDSVVYWPGFDYSWTCNEVITHPLEPSLMLASWSRTK